MTADDLKNDVRAWIDENLNHAPGSWIKIAERLSTHSDMAPAWKELAKRDIQGRHVMTMAIEAAGDAEAECRRTLTTSEEIERLNAVTEAANKLIEAIGSAPLLDAAHIMQINGKSAWFAWRESGSKFAEKNGGPLPIINLTELLKCAVSQVEKDTQSAPARLVKRQRDDPELAAFVRAFVPMIEKATGQKMMGTVAHIATATLNLSEPITKQQVQSILKG